MRYKFESKGFKELEDKLSQLDESNIDNAIRQSARIAVDLVTEKAKSNLKSSPIQTNDAMMRGIRTVALKDDVGARSKASRVGRPKGADKTYKNDSNLLHIFEDGTVERYWKTFRSMRKSTDRATRAWAKAEAQNDLKHPTGKIQATHFFKDAVTSEEQNVENTYMRELLAKLNSLTHNSIK